MKKTILLILTAAFCLSSCVSYDKTWETAPTTTREPIPELDLPEDPQSDPFAEGLIDAFYSGLLGRSPLQEEMDITALQLSTGTITPKDIVRDILATEEFQAIILSNQGYVDRIFGSLLGTEASEAAADYWVRMLENGTTRDEMAEAVMDYPEFNEFCEAFGYEAGSEDEEEGYVEITPDEVPDIVDQTRDIILQIDGDETLTTFGGYYPGITTLDQIDAAIAELDESGYDVGFVLIDLRTGKGIAYNPDQGFYTASSIKGPYAASFCFYNPDKVESWENTIQNMLINSDNDAYTSLNGAYGREYIKQWCEEAGVDPAPCNYKYPYLSSRDMSLLWLQNYKFFMTDPTGQEVCEWFQEPTYSLIREVVGEMYITQSKAGWLVDEEPRHRTTCDSGIVYADNGTYIVSITSDVASTIDPLIPLMEALNAAHDEMC
ncbi:MAG: serine hydrolase [Clostridiales bacterium]|nr:serine hydrolase [Clostridiales bacterium]